MSEGIGSVTPPACNVPPVMSPRSAFIASKSVTVILPAVTAPSSILTSVTAPFSILPVVTSPSAMSFSFVLTDVPVKLLVLADSLPE